MNIYHKNLRRLTLTLIVIILIDVAISLFSLISSYFLDDIYGDMLPKISSSAIFVKNALVFLIAAIATNYYRLEKYRRRIVWTEGLLLLTAVAVTVYENRKIDDLLDLPIIMAAMLFYTMVQYGRGDRNWNRVSKLPSTTLDIKLKGRNEWFNTMMIGPHLELNQEIASVVDHYLETIKVPAPLEVVVHGLGDISEAMTETYKDIYVAHYEDEEHRINYYLEGRYFRAIVLVIISLIAVIVSVKYNRFFRSTVVWEVLRQFAGFSLWQVGATYFERSQGYNSLLRTTIAKNATVKFL